MSQHKAAKKAFNAFSFNDPLGERTAKALVAGDLQLNRGIIDSIGPFLSMLSIFLFMVAFVFSTGLLLKRSEYRKSLAQKLPMLIGLIVYSSIFTVMVIFWRL